MVKLLITTEHLCENIKFYFLQGYGKRENVTRYLYSLWKDSDKIIQHVAPGSCQG